MKHKNKRTEYKCIENSVVHIIGILGGQERENGAEAVLAVIETEASLPLMKNIKSQIRESTELSAELKVKNKKIHISTHYSATAEKQRQRGNPERC